MKKNLFLIIGLVAMAAGLQAKSIKPKAGSFVVQVRSVTVKYRANTDYQYRTLTINNKNTRLGQSIKIGATQILSCIVGDKRLVLTGKETFADLEKQGFVFGATNKSSLLTLTTYATGNKKPKPSCPNCVIKK